ncbi:MAG: c-type cytochrome [Acidobacteria bacterium]|nr:c-type cytochrome [Acidobacteriota bacterium]MCA1611075.1 c-type cytochrome [Acidobacteriota bacterium]
MSKPKGILLVLLLAFLAGGAVLFAGMVRRGFSARDTPSMPEAFMAQRMRRWSIPAKAREMKNPFADSAEAVAGGRAHFADHCATCHGNDGRGKTEIGQNLYPKAPDMWGRETQKLSDGEIFYIIKNGVRLTGMPAWGQDTPEDDRQSWHLVAFIRHMPRITAEELEAMKAMNPVSPMEMKEEKETDEFLEGGDASRPSPEHKPAAKHGH